MDRKQRRAARKAKRQCAKGNHHANFLKVENRSHWGSYGGGLVTNTYIVCVEAKGGCGKLVTRVPDLAAAT